MALAGSAAADWRLLLMVVSLSLFYVGGMFLNDAFDHGFDAKARPERPIPSGEVSAAQVHAFGFGMMFVGLVLLAWVGYRYDPLTQWRPVAAGFALAAAIVFYNWHHKNNPLSPLVMGACRMLVYLTAALAVSAIVPQPVVLAAVVLLCYLIGLTYAAKKEHLGRLEKRILLPKPETMVLEQDRFTIESASPNLRRTLALNDYPVVRAFVESIRATLAGDLQTLTRFYRINVEGNSEQWRLSLAPTEPAMLAVVRQIRIGGSKNRIVSIEVIEAEGDRSVTTITADAP